MAAAMAYQSGLPPIKCSDCGREMDITLIADHTCAPVPAEPLKPMDRINNAFSSLRVNDKVPGPFKSRPAPSGINTSVANRPYLQPVPPSPSRSSPYRMPPRSATSPALRNRSPSPELAMAQECAFPTFPTTQNPPQRAHTDSPFSHRGTESRSESRSGSRADSRAGYGNFRKRTTSIHNPVSGPTSPVSATPDGSRTGAFTPESTRKSSFSSAWSRPDMDEETPEVPPMPAFHETRSHSPAGSIAGLRLPFGSPNREEHDPLSTEHQEEPPEDPHPPHPPPPENRSVRRQPSQGSIHFRKPSMSAATRPLYEIGSTRNHRSTASRGGSPNKLDVDFNPPRSGSAQSHRSDWRLYDAPPVPGMSAQIENADTQRNQGYGSNQTKTLEYNVGSNPYHSPSESTSSHGSARQTSSSRSSPPTSTSFAPIQKHSDAGETRLFDNLAEPAPAPAPLHISVPHVPPQSSSPVSAPVSSNTYNQLPPPPLPPAPISAPPINNPQPFQHPPRTRRPTKSFSRPNAYQPDPQPQSAPPLRQPVPHLMYPPESPMDPAMQGGRLPTLNSPDPNSYNRVLSPDSPIDHPHSAPLYGRSPTIPELPPPPSFLPTERTPSGSSPVRRATTAHKGNCRGCGELIKGKSVSSADGRLTGRWHRQCFVCKTCREPFQTTDFYVLGNHPYCARHYHELNRSMCTKCDRGIEGQYVQTDRRVKYHPHCFTCQDCHLILRDNYFENATGKILCEQHAFKTNHLGPGRRFPEKRSTRLMMMV